MNRVIILLAIAACVLTVTGPDGPWLVCWGALLALTGWRVFVAFWGEGTAVVGDGARPIQTGAPR